MMEYYEHKLDHVGQRPDWLSDKDRVIDVDPGSPFDGFEYTVDDLIWEKVHTIRIPASHWAVPALKAGKVPVRKPALTEEMVEVFREMATYSRSYFPPRLRERVSAILAELGPADPIKAALQDKWPALDTDALRETLARHNLKIVEA